ncbi:hypothetical protein [Actinokineospora terrae]|uniref:Uncharacterized protein n=1 Tax=Actinokineospora terrae TaxID=155974 RepID=A0A1H9RUY2_9PSEU|nr:hypothetical protein [Actinokineospora terrae]SER76235.1 hypothetical protein SAMN04487818_10594 [Actinokineospora terrae]
MNDLRGKGYSASVAIEVDFCEITTDVGINGTEIDFNGGSEFAILFSPRGLDNLIEKATAAREEYNREFGTDSPADR